MVRRDAVTAGTVTATEAVAARCTSPAGESPAPVSVGAPDSRPQVSTAILFEGPGRIFDHVR